MTFRPTTLERAYQLAESGGCKTVGDVRRKLVEEGYAQVAEQLYGSTIQAALRTRCRDAWKEPPEEASEDEVESA